MGGGRLMITRKTATTFCWAGAPIRSLCWRVGMRTNRGIQGSRGSRRRAVAIQSRHSICTRRCRYSRSPPSQPTPSPDQDTRSMNLATVLGAASVPSDQHVEENAPTTRSGRGRLSNPGTSTYVMAATVTNQLWCSILPPHSPPLSVRGQRKRGPRSSNITRNDVTSFGQSPPKMVSQAHTQQRMARASMQSKLYCCRERSNGRHSQVTSSF